MEEEVKKAAQEHFPALLAQGAETLLIEFDGEGDEGFIGAIYGSALPMTKARATYDANFDNREVVSLEITKEQENVLTDYAENLLPSGYQDNNGSCGVIKINLKTKDVEVRVYWKRIAFSLDVEKIKGNR
jgi:hypothetical protein